MRSLNDELYKTLSVEQERCPEFQGQGRETQKDRAAEASGVAYRTSEM